MLINHCAVRLFQAYPTDYWRCCTVKPFISVNCAHLLALAVSAQPPAPAPGITMFIKMKVVCLGVRIKVERLEFELGLESE